jgi:transcriptional regulator with XRE-family HTH domain
MKRTADDDVYVARFALELRQKYERAKKNGVTDQVFAESIGVERPSLDRYLDGEAMPSVRTVVLAYKNHEVAVPYMEISVEKALPRKTRSRAPLVSDQMVLPLKIEAEKSGARFDLKLDSISARKYSLKVTVRRTG